MADLTLSEAASRYIATVKESSRQPVLAELNRFVRWYGAGRPLTGLRAHDVSRYADVLGPATPETSRRADYVRVFLTYLKKQGLTDTSLGPHLRPRKSTRAQTVASAAAQAGAVELTRDGVEALRAEVDQLIAQRAHVRAEIGRAMLDKDFRENSPLDAAKEKQGHVEARIRELEAMLKRAVVVERGGHHGKVRVGTTVVGTNVGA